MVKIINPFFAKEIKFECDEFEAYLDLSIEQSAFFLGALTLLGNELISHFEINNFKTKFSLDSFNSFDLTKGISIINLDRNSIGYLQSKIAFLLYHGYPEVNHYHVRLNASGFNELDEIDLILSLQGNPKETSVDEIQQLLNED